MDGIKEFLIQLKRKKSYPPKEKEMVFLEKHTLMS